MDPFRLLEEERPHKLIMNLLKNIAWNTLIRSEESDYSWRP